MKSVAVIDYGMGNLHSVAKALEHVCPDTRVYVTNDAAKIEACDRVVLPGVGAMRDCMAEIKRLGVDQIVADQMGKKPILGICVGMQALMQHSSENGGVDCLGELPGDVSFFGDQPSVQQAHLKVPHMGWSQVQQKPHKLWHGIEDNSRFYFVHSYHFVPKDKTIISGTCEHGSQLVASIEKDNIFATQFHPEKSHDIGTELLMNFLKN